MPQFERRLYEPSDDVRAYDGGDDDYVEEGSRLPLLIVIALVVLASFAGVVWLAYTQGVQRGREDTPRIVAAAAPKVQNEQKNPYTGLQIYQPAKRESDNGQSAPQTTPAVSPRKPATAAPVKKTAGTAMPVAPPAISTPKPAIAAPQTITALIEAQQKNAQAAPAQKPAAAPAKPAPAQTATAPSALAERGGGGFVLQIGSYPSEAEASTSWESYKSAHPAVAGYAPDIQKADLGRKGTWYRLRVGPFATLGEASAACAKVKAQGGSCFPAKR
jgi:cell division protein FtsN